MTAVPAKPLISVVIPAFNYGATLERAVVSVLSQAGDDFDVWIIDDGSTDHTPQIASALQQRWPSTLHYRRQDNRGPAAARNHGVNLSSGAYLVFLDADDELLPEAMAAFREGIVANPDAVVFLADHMAVEANGKIKHRRQKQLPKSPQKRLRDYLLDKTIIACQGAVLFRREVFAHYRYPESFRAAEDTPLFAYALANFPCTLLHAATVRVHKHHDSLRGNADAAAAAGLQLVEEIFEPTRLPTWAMGLKAEYTARRHLSLFRTLQQTGRHEDALAHYWAALHRSPISALRPAYFGKALRAIGRCFEQRFSRSTR